MKIACALLVACLLAGCSKGIAQGPLVVGRSLPRADQPCCGPTPELAGRLSPPSVPHRFRLAERRPLRSILERPHMPSVCETIAKRVAYYEGRLDALCCEATQENATPTPDAAPMALEQMGVCEILGQALAEWRAMADSCHCRL